jgi:hypothetical protein
MQRYILVTGIVGLALAVAATAPALALTAKQKHDTCVFGADHPKLAGKERERFIRDCMANRNDPRGPAVGTPGAASGPPGDVDAPEEAEPKI